MFFFFNDTATTEIYTLSLHDALPISQQVVHPPVQGLATDRGVAGEGPLGGGVDPIFDRWGPEDLEGSGEVVGQALDDDGVATEREVRPVLFARAHRHEEAGIALKNETHLVRDEGFEVQRRAHVALAACVATIAATEWLHGGAAALAWAAGAAGGAPSVAPRPGGPRAPPPPPPGPARAAAPWPPPCPARPARGAGGGAR